MTPPNQNAFTNDALKRWKEYFNGIDKGWPTPVLPREIEALLARLEAAEWSAENHGGCALADECICDPCKAWRESKGE